jgi:Putative transposase
MALFRGQLLAAVGAAVQRGTLTLPDGMPLRHWAILRTKLGRTTWNVPIRERYPHGAGVRTYLARYICGGPIANHRLVSCTQGVVTFGYRLNGEGTGGEHPRQGRMRVSSAECIRRSRWHVPAPGSFVPLGCMRRPKVRCWPVIGSRWGKDR